ncbi:hypothetical protein D3C74_338390 [compost metagenome]
MVMRTRPASAAACAASSSRIMVPSSLTSSAIPPTSPAPARRTRSTAASVCPARCSTPPGTARRGRTCPGRMRSPEPEAGSARTCRVRARSAAEMPVVTPVAASTVTVYAVRRGSWLCGTMSGRSRASARAAGMGAHR